MTRACAALALLLLAGCDQLDPMLRQRDVKVKPYQVSSFYADGVAMRAPPPGTVAAAAAHPPEVAAGIGPDGKAIARIPIPVTPELLALGRRKFEVNCAVCHGFLADGDSLVAKNMSQRPPPSLLARAQQPDGWYFQVMSEGFGLMPSYASVLPIEERWAIVAYIRALQLSQSARAADLAPGDRAKLDGERR